MSLIFTAPIRGLKRTSPDTTRHWVLSLRPRPWKSGPLMFPTPDETVIFFNETVKHKLGFRRFLCNNFIVHMKSSTWKWASLLEMILWKSLPFTCTKNTIYSYFSVKKHKNRSKEVVIRILSNEIVDYCPFIFATAYILPLLWLECFHHYWYLFKPYERDTLLYSHLSILVELFFIALLYRLKYIAVFNVIRSDITAVSNFSFKGKAYIRSERMYC